MRSTTLIILLCILASPLWSASWQVAPASASAGFSDAEQARFSRIREDENLESFLIGKECWLWLKTTVNVREGDTAFLFTGSELGWYAWWNDEFLATQGAGPPYWRPASPYPGLYSFGGNTGVESNLLVKCYVRPGYGELPELPVFGTEASLQAMRTQSLLVKIGIPTAVILLGILLFIGGIAAFLSGFQVWDASMAFFGLFLGLSLLEPLLSLVPGIGLLLPWIVPALIIQAAFPLALSAWRRSVCNAGGRDALIFSIPDTILALVTALWVSLSVLGTILPGKLGRLQPYLTINPLPYFVLWTVGLALISWMISTLRKRTGRIGSLLILLSAIAASFPGIVGNPSLLSLVDEFRNFGLPAALFTTVLVMMARHGIRLSTSPGKRDSQTSQKEADDEVEEFAALEAVEDDIDDIPELQELTDEDYSRPAENVIETGVQAADRDTLMRSLRGTLYPEALPWDIHWDLASARQGSSHPSTGFHDVYLDSEGHLTGFSFMDSGSGTLESMFFAHLVKGEFTRCYPSVGSLPRMARSVHRKSVQAAAAAGHGMIGVFGRFRETGLSFLPLSLPPLMLRKATGEIVSLQPSGESAGNPPLGSSGFGSKGLRTMKLRMDSGDCLLAYAPSILDSVSASGEKWGRRSLAGAFRNAAGPKADQIVADIIGELKDFTGRDRLETPLQILVIRRR